MDDRLFEQNVIGTNSTTTETTRFNWTAPTTKLLIEEVRNHTSLINKKIYMQRKVWKDIAANFHKQGHNVSDDQCAIKWKNLKKKYKDIQDNNNTTGQAAQIWQYFESIQEILNTSPEVSPISLASNINGFRNREGSPNINIEESNNVDDSAVSNTSSGAIRTRKRQTRSGQMMEQLYMQREKHHKKNIEMQERFLKLFEKYIQRQNED